MDNVGNTIVQEQSSVKTSTSMVLNFTNLSAKKEINIEGKSKIKFDILLFKKGRKTAPNLSLFLQYLDAPSIDNADGKQLLYGGEFLLLNVREFDKLDKPEDVDSVIETRKISSLKTVKNSKTVELKAYNIGNEPFDFDVFLDLE